MPRPVPEGHEPLSRLSRRDASEAVDRALRTTHDAIRFTAAAAAALGSRAWEDEWVRPGGDRRLYARDPERPGWLVAQAILELALDVPPPPSWADEVLMPDGTRKKFSELFGERPKPQPEGPDQRSGELRLIVGERHAQWSYDQGGQLRERCRGQGAGGDGALPFLRDARLLVPDPQRPHPLFLRDDLDVASPTPEGLARRFAALEFASFSDVRVWMPVPVPGGPALAARRAVQELRRAAWEGRWSYPSSGWVVLDGYVADVVATGATFESAFASWQDAVRLYNPVPRDSKVTPAEAARARRELERAVERLEERGETGEATTEVGPDGTIRTSMQAAFMVVPPREMPFPPRRPECAPAVALRLPVPPALPPGWRAAGFTDVVRALDEEGRFGHGFVARDPDGAVWFVGDMAARTLDPATARAAVREADAGADRRDHELWGDRFPVPTKGSGWRTSQFTVLADGGRALGPLVRTGWSTGPVTGGLEPAASFMVTWSRPDPS